MAYTCIQHLSSNDATRYLERKFDYWENNALENHLSWCKEKCTAVLEEAWFNLESKRLMQIPSQTEAYITHRLDFANYLSEIVRRGQRCMVPN